MRGKSKALFFSLPVLISLSFLILLFSFAFSSSFFIYNAGEGGEAGEDGKKIEVKLKDGNKSSQIIYPDLFWAEISVKERAGKSGVSGKSKAESENFQPLKFNILFITIDSLRPDHLSCYGYFRKTSPNIDSLAEEGIVFLNAWAVSSWTSPSLVSIFSSLYPTRHGVAVRGFVLNSDIKTPVESLAELGWKTYGQHWTGDTIGNLGFMPTGDDPMQFLRNHKDELFFAWFHLRGPHLPYNPPQKYIDEFAKGMTADVEKIRLIISEKIIFKSEGKLPELSEEEKKFVIALYDADVRAQDDEIGEILKELVELGIWDKTIVVITSDHGEELFEHGWVGHASTSRESSLYNELIRIPIIIRVPRLKGPFKVSTPTSQIDIMPILFEILGLNGDYHSDGISTIKFDRKKFSVSALPLKREIYAETSPCGWQCKEDEKWKRIYALIQDDIKIIYYNTDFGPGRFELFRLPDETRNLAHSEKELLLKMSTNLFNKISYLKSRASLFPPEPVK